jgi:hypothetical protein
MRATTVRNAVSAMTNRAGDHPREHLAGYTGIMQARIAKIAEK